MGGDQFLDDGEAGAAAFGASPCPTPQAVETCGSSSAGMPGPVSVTSTSASAAVAGGVAERVAEGLVQMW
ncbi:hypothetical protein AB0D38_23345 [Streptomyces sp. NPDC048279]|uniref:hypothetical protein n=1 Tax=Streptomyces sp. NPDC048279 TaxID=3154714 RepID=UPI00342B000E